MKPYSGCLRNLHYSNNKVSRYLNDTSEMVCYRFNDFGFRKTELELHPSQSIFICGCSYTFGVGLPIEETWGNIFADQISTNLRQKFGLWNLAQGGASNDYIARIITTQLHSETPRAVFVMFTFFDRAEHNAAAHVGECIGRWNSHDYAARYFSATSNEDALIRMLKNILLVQLACKSRNVPLRFLCLDLPSLKQLRCSYHPVIREYATQIDWLLLIECEDLDARLSIDFALDGMHPGVESNRAIGRLVAEAFIKEIIL